MLDAGVMYAFNRQNLLFIYLFIYLLLYWADSSADIAQGTSQSNIRNYSNIYITVIIM